MRRKPKVTWKSKRTAETRKIEDLLLKKFQKVDAYRYNSAWIRVRVVDDRFENMPVAKRDKLVEPHLKKLPQDTQDDIVQLFTLSPSELKFTEVLKSDEVYQSCLNNLHFENPTESMLD